MITKKRIKDILTQISIPNLILFIGLIVIIITPNTKFNNHKIDYVEKRSLAEFPQIIINKKPNNKFFQGFEAFYNDRHRKRADCIEVYQNIKNFINRRKENTFGTEGREGWIFFKGDGSVANYQNKNLFTDKDLKKIKDNMERLIKWGEENGITVVFMIPPDKNRIYGEYFPPQYKKVNPKSRVQLLKEYLNENSDMDIVYPVALIMERKKIDNEPLYYHGDTHWTAEGAYIGYSALVSEINKRTNNDFQLVDIKQLETETLTFEQKFGRAMDTCTKLNIPECNDRKYKFIVKEKNGYNPIKYKYKIGIIGDSFSGELLNFLNYNFDTSFYWYNETMELFDSFSMKTWEDKILKDKPDVLVVEFLERYAYELLNLY